VSINWGDGHADSVALGAGATGFSPFSHTFADNGVYTVSVQVADGDGATSNILTTAVSVANVAPTATFSADGPHLPGQPVTFSFTNQFDPSAADTVAGFRYWFDFDNDGTFD